MGILEILDIIWNTRNIDNSRNLQTIDLIEKEELEQVLINASKKREIQRNLSRIEQNDNDVVCTALESLNLLGIEFGRICFFSCFGYL